MTRDDFDQIQKAYRDFCEAYDDFRQTVKFHAPDSVYKKLKNAFLHVDTAGPFGFNQFVDNTYTFEQAMEALEEEIDPESEGPQEGDYTTEDHRKFYQYGKLVLDLTEEESEQWQKHVKAHMDKEKFWPSVFWISDHGNAHLLNLERSS